MIGLDYDNVYFPTEGLAAVAKKDVYGERKWGFIDQQTGAVAIPLEYDDVTPFSEGLAAVMKYGPNGERKWGFINKTGSAVLPPEYDYAEMIEDGSYGWVYQGASCGYFENPYYVAAAVDEAPAPAAGVPKSEAGGFPMTAVLIAAGAVAVALAVAVVVVALKKKRRAVPPPASTVAGLKFCPNCGAPLTPGMQFCSKCGKPIQG